MPADTKLQQAKRSNDNLVHNQNRVQTAKYLDLTSCWQKENKSNFCAELISKWQLNDSPQKEENVTGKAQLCKKAPVISKSLKQLRTWKNKKLILSETSLWTRRDRKTRLWVKGVPQAEIHWPRGMKEASLLLWLAADKRGEAYCAGWGLQTGGQSGGEIIALFWGISSSWTGLAAADMTCG